MNRPTEFSNPERLDAPQPSAPVIDAVPPPEAPQGAAPAAYSPTMVVPDSRRKSPLLAMILSSLPGVGQVYVGYYQLGFVHAIVFAVVVAMLASESLGGLTPVVAIFMAFFWLYNVIDAGRRASLYNLALAGGEPIHLPDGFEMPKFGGSLTGGVLLLAVGLLLLLNLQFGMSLEWIQDWWPAGLMIVGAYLVVQAVRERSAAKEASEL